MTDKIIIGYSITFAFMEMEMNVLGIMSGTSVDGLDLALTHIQYDGSKTTYQLLAAETISYDRAWTLRLKQVMSLSGVELVQLNHEYGQLIGRHAADFLKRHRLECSLIASHGHTVFHQPEHGITLQTGSGADIAAITGINTVCDFRSLDVALGGQGAPLVPIGDELFFSEFDYCLNLGGIANISCHYNGQRIAFDICPANMALNLIAEQLGYSFDKDGELASKGMLNKSLLEQLNGLSQDHLPFPRSLGAEWFNQQFLPILKSFDLRPEDKLHTVSHHIAYQISKALIKEANTSATILVTGGGARNNYLIHLIKHYTGAAIILPDSKIIDFKEAIIFALLGFLRYNHQINTLSSVTGSSINSSGGVIYRIIPPKQ